MQQFIHLFFRAGQHRVEAPGPPVDADDMDTPRSEGAPVAPLPDEEADDMPETEGREEVGVVAPAGDDGVAPLAVSCVLLAALTLPAACGEARPSERDQT
jgi:hypothetical protein